MYIVLNYIFFSQLKYFLNPCEDKMQTDKRMMKLNSVTSFITQQNFTFKLI